LLKKQDEMSLIFRDIVNKRGKNKGTDNPSLKGCNVLGTHNPRDASSKGCIIQGMHHPRDASSQGCIIPGMHNPRNESSRDASSRDA
jgi:hypothetical protein